MIRRHVRLVANRLLEPFSLRLERSSRLAEMGRAEARLAWLTELEAREPWPESLPRGQLGQDLFALWATSFMRGGFFVEFGAADGVTLSNTVLLERSFAWRGIVAEPARKWHDALARNRRCVIDTRCVWSRSGERLPFAETERPEYSTLHHFVGQDDGHREHRRSAIEYHVESVSLNDLLAEHAAPRRIDYLSVDTEGTEYEILKEVDFRRWEIRVLTVEHNHDPTRKKKVFDLLSNQGFCRVFEELSLFDDWYVDGALMPLPGVVSSSR